MNILLSCAGRRSYLVDYFKRAVGNSGKIYVTNSSAEATAMVAADGAFIAPPLYSQEYLPFIKRICEEYEVKLLVSLFDMDLPIIATHKQELEVMGITVAVSDYEIINICNDKLRTIEFLKSLNLKTLTTTTNLDEAEESIRKGKLGLPVYVKPRWGMGSLAMSKVDNPKDIRTIYDKTIKDINDTYIKYYESFDKNEAVLIQEQASGTEYGLDIINDFQGNYVTTFVKRKMEMRSGETDCAVTEKIPELEDLGRKIGTRLGHIGNLDVDVFWDGSEPIVLEMNARFGGGYPFSHLAGADLPAAYVHWTKGLRAPERFFQIQYGKKGLKDIRIINFDSINLLRHDK